MTRVLSGAVLVALAIAVVWFVPPLVFEAFAVIVALLAAWELFLQDRSKPADAATS